MPEPISGGAVLIETGLELIKRVAPQGIARFSTWIKGKTLLLVGQARSGKTTFADYFQWGIIEPEQETERTYPDQAKRPSFVISIGSHGTLQLSFKRSFDLPGQPGPANHAEEAFNKRPHSIIIMSDLTADLRNGVESASGSWLQEFCHHYEELWRASDRRRNRLHHMLLVLNKSDKVDARRIAPRKRALAAILEKELTLSRGKVMGSIPIKKCCCVDNPNSTKLMDMVISHIARGLTR